MIYHKGVITLGQRSQLVQFNLCLLTRYSSSFKNSVTCSLGLHLPKNDLETTVDLRCTSVPNFNQFLRHLVFVSQMIRLGLTEIGILTTIKFYAFQNLWCLYW